MSTELRKAAIVLASLDVDTAITVCRHMPDHEAEKVIAEMARLGSIDGEEQRRALEEFSEHVEHSPEVQPADRAERLMSAVLGHEHRLRQLSSAPPESIRQLLIGETPQMVAVVLSQLTAQKAAQVLAQWPEEARSDLALRVAKLGRPAPGVIDALGEVLSRPAYRVEQDGGENALEFVVQLLSDMDRSASTRLLTELRERDPLLAEQVEAHLFTFEDTVQLSDPNLQVLLRELDNATIARALKGVEEEIKERVFANLSERAREILTQEMEFLGPVLVRDVEAAQREFVNTALRLEELGEITLGGDEAAYVE